MSKTIISGGVTFMDLTDSRKLEAYITSNLPTAQIFDQNTNKYNPDWNTTNLQLSVDVYLDAKLVTSDSNTVITWYKKVGTQAKTQVGTGSKLNVNGNQLTGSTGIITYICEAKYNDNATNPPTAHAEIVFTRVDTGLNGSDGDAAPTVIAQYSIDGTTGWTATLDTSTHKYIRHSYDGGTTWTAAIKMVGEDGTSVRIKGTATSVTAVEGTDYYTLVYDSNILTGAELGDSYLYDGNLYVCADSRSGQDYFINVGAIQGPKGSDGISSYVFIRYATDASGTGMSTSPNGKTYMGVYTSNTNTPPTTASVYTWSKFVGDNAKSIVLSGDSQVFKVSKTGVIAPATIKVTSQAFNTTSTNWTYSTNGGQTFLSTVPTGVSRNGDIVTVTGSSITSNSIVIKASDGEVEDIFTIYKAVDGADGSKGNDGAPAPIAFLTNENITFSANAQGQIATTTITSNVVAYNGATKVAPTIGTITGIPTGMTITQSTVSASNEIMLTMTIANNSTFGSASSNMGIISIPVTYPVSTVLSLTWSKVNTGPTGAAGAAGADAYTVILTNESNTFAGDVSNAIAGSTTTQALAYKGATAQTVTILSVNNKAAAIVDTDTGITGLKFKCSELSGTNPTITFTCTTAFKTASGSIPIVLSVGGVSFTKMFTYSIAFKGSPGSTGAAGPQGSAGVPATAYWLVSSASAVQKTSTGTIKVTPSTLSFAGKSQTGTGTPTDYACRWIIDYSTDGTNYTNLYTSSANEASKSITVATTYKTIRVRMYLAGGTATLLDEQIIPVVSDGATGSKGVDAVTFQIYAPNGYLLSNKLESLTLQTFAYDGSTAITSATYAWSYQENDAWVAISNANTSSLTLTKDDVIKSKTYRCAMTYKGTTYYSTATVQDTTDIYDVMICVSDNINPLTGIYYWVVYALLYSEQGEADALLGPISINAPTSPVSGDYWYAVDAATQTVTLKKYNGSTWAASTDKQAYAYDWRHIIDGTQQQAIGNSDKVQIISCNSFTSSATFQCIVTDTDGSKLARCNIHLTDTSDPIVSATAPVGVKDGQLWMQTQTDGTFLLYIWAADTSTWKQLNADTKNVVHTTKPSTYKAGDLWVVESDTVISGYTKGTLLQSNATTTTFAAAHWSPSLKYESEISDVQNALKAYKQYMTVDSNGLHMQAKNEDGTLSPFQALFTNTRLSFYQDDLEVAYISDNKLNIYEANIDVLSVEKKIQLQKFEWAIESNGSMSLIVNY